MKQKTIKKWRPILWLALLLFVVAPISALDILETSPVDSINDNPVLLEVTTDVTATCRYDVTDIAYENMSASMTDVTTFHTVDLGSLTEGAYVYYVRCANTSESMDTSTIVSFAVDRTAPQILSTAPTGAINEQLTSLEVITNEQATCRYDSEDTDFASMTQLFEETGTTTHTHILRNLEQQEYTYFVTCQDTAGNILSTASPLSFMVDLPPTAIISIAGDDPLKAGTYSVSVLTSENMLNPPLLQYDFHDDTAKKGISLVGEDTYWHGYMIINEDTPNKIGSFYFTGKDESGVEGTFISSGQLFLVDTKKPVAPSSIEASDDLKRKIRIDWHYDGEEIDYFRIYRSENSGVDYVDYLDDKEDDYFTDKNVDEYVDYFYRVTAVDKAGNEGPMSPEITGVAVDRIIEEDEEDELQDLLSPSQLKKINDTIKLIEREMLDVEENIAELERETDANTIDVINELDLVKKAKNVRLNMENLIFELQDLTSSELNDDDLEKIINKVKINLVKFKTDVAYHVSIEESAAYTQVLDTGDVTAAITEVILGLDFDEAQRADYVALIEELQYGMTVDVKLVAAEISYHNSDADQPLTLIKKTVSSTDSYPSISLVETVPKDVARRASDIIFKQIPVVLKEDPVVKWSFSDFTTTTISYRIDALVDLSAIKLAKTVAIIEPALFLEPEPEPDNPITGQALTEGIQDKVQLDYGNAVIILGIFVILGLVVYYVFFIKTEEEYEAAVETGKKSLKESKIMKKVTSTLKGWKQKPKKIITRQTHLQKPTPPALPKQEQSDIVHDEHIWGAFNQAVSLAHLYANADDFQKAYGLYVQALNLYHGLQEGSYVAEDASYELNKVYTKLQLQKILEHGHAFIDNMSVIGLRQVLLETNELMHHAEGDLMASALGDKIKSTQQYFLTALKGMEQDLQFPHNVIQELK